MFRPIDAPLAVEHEAYVQQSLEQVNYEPIDSGRTPEHELTELSPDGDRSDDTPWQVTLMDVLQLALNNTEIIKQDAQFLSASNPLHLTVEGVASDVDPEIQASGINFGNRGVAAALSDFMPRASGNLVWSRDETVQNSLFSGGLTPGQVLESRTADFDLRLEKVFAWGGQATFGHNIDYSATNAPAVLFPSVYTGSLSLNYQHPLWAGSGTEFTQIAGPLSQLNPRILSVNQGVLIARIDGELARIDFQQSVNQLVKDVADVYWDLYLARQALSIEISGHERLKKILEVEKAELESGRSSASIEAEAADAFYAAVARVEEAWGRVNLSELRLRRLLGLPASDGKTLIPVDVPEDDEVLPEYLFSVATARANRPELQRTQLQLRSLRLQLKAAEKLVAPRVDLLTGYRVNGLGDELVSHSDRDGVTRHGYRSYYGDLTQGNATGWDAGIVFSMPLGFQQERAQVRNLELRLVKAQASIRAQENEISQEVAFAYQQTQRGEKISRAAIDRLAAARRRLASAEAEYDADRVPLNRLIEARLALSQAQLEFSRSLVEQTKSWTEFHHRLGTLLAALNVAMSFGGNPPSLPSQTVEQRLDAASTSPAEINSDEGVDPESKASETGRTENNDMTIKPAPPSEKGTISSDLAQRVLEARQERAEESIKKEENLPDEAGNQDEME